MNRFRCRARQTFFNRFESGTTSTRQQKTGIDELSQPGAPFKSTAPEVVDVNRAYLQTPSTTHPGTCFSHNSSSLHSPILDPSGNLGKQVSLHPLHTLHFQNSSIPQPQFRKPTNYPTSSLQRPSPQFPLFRCQRRVLLFSFLLSYYFSSLFRRTS